MAQGLSRAYQGDAIQSATAFLIEATPFLGLDAHPERLTFAESRATDFGNQVVFQQTLSGVPVLGRQVGVNLTAQGEVLATENTTAPLPDVNVQPSVSALTVAAFAKGRIIKAPSLAVDAGGPEPRLVWRMVDTSAPDMVIRTTVDAHTGDVLRRENLIQKYDTGHGKVYTGNPVSTPTLTTQPLPWMTGGGLLTGLYAKVFNGEPPGVQDVNVPSLVYDYAAGTIPLAEVQAYYAVTRIHDYFQNNLGYSRNYQTPAYVHIDMDNAFFSPSLGTDGGMAFGYYGGVEYALDSDVIFHEYAHSIIDKRAPAFANAYDNYHEPGGINEGLADYFSCSLLNDPVLAEYALAGGWERDLRNRNHFPEDLGMLDYDSITNRYFQTFPEVHRTGETWGPACWDLRMALGQTVADNLLFRALSMFLATTRMQDAVNYIITADNQAYAGAHVATIRKVFNGRGIYETAYPVSYLNPDSFYSSTVASNASKVYTGYAFISGAYFYEYDFFGLGLFPAFVADRWYCLLGYTTDTTIQSVFIVLKSSQGALLGYSGNSASSLPAITSAGIAKTYKKIATYYKFPASLIPAGQKAIGARIYIQCYDKPYATVNAAFATTAPKSASPASPTVYTAQLLRVRPGDINADNSINIRDVLIALRYVTGRDYITAWEAPQGDIVAPFAGKPDMADVKQMLKVAAGLA